MKPKTQDIIGGTVELPIIFNNFIAATPDSSVVPYVDYVKVHLKLIVFK